ncbi:hypothetical protein [Actinoplanes subtropicus]|uniref:hypothetical protein n=1 Tax=Actinoplanes subtropicus TaxID=543632 RepID=UPI0004C3D88C|nr:hypothetical protein [Actinoplanes subtropicus]
MKYRRHGSKPTVALWTLIAVADLGLLVGAIGAATMLLILVGLVALVGGVVAARAFLLRSVDAREAVARRRA